MVRGSFLLTAVLLVVFVSALRTVAQRPATAPTAAVDPAPVPVVGIANVTFKVSDVSKAHAYYEGVLGMPQAFETKDAAGKTASLYFKVNDDQFIEVTPTLKPGENVREARVVFQSSDLEKLHSLYASRGLNPGKISKGPDGNPVFRIVDPEGTNLDFLQYVSDSQQSKLRGK